MQEIIKAPKVLIGLGNPGAAYSKTRHNIGFMILDALLEKYGQVDSWRVKDNLMYATITIGDSQVLLVKPQTFMNNSGNIIGYLTKQGIKLEQALVIHDELEMPFGKLAIKMGGSARGHNGLKSLISIWGDQFARLRFGIGRPERREDVPDYVLQNFKENRQDVADNIEQAIALIEDLYR